jgi:hypothetical protein
MKLKRSATILLRVSCGRRREGTWHQCIKSSLLDPIPSFPYDLFLSSQRPFKSQHLSLSLHNVNFDKIKSHLRKQDSRSGQNRPASTFQSLDSSMA